MQDRTLSSLTVHLQSIITPLKTSQKCIFKRFVVKNSPNDLKMAEMDLKICLLSYTRHKGDMLTLIFTGVAAFVLCWQRLFALQQNNFNSFWVGLVLPKSIRRVRLVFFIVNWTVGKVKCVQQTQINVFKMYWSHLELMFGTKCWNATAAFQFLLFEILKLSRKSELFEVKDCSEAHIYSINDLRSWSPFRRKVFNEHVSSQEHKWAAANCVSASLEFHDGLSTSITTSSWMWQRWLWSGKVMKVIVSP